MRLHDIMTKLFTKLFIVLFSILISIGGAYAYYDYDPLKGARNLPSGKRVHFVLGQDGDTLLNFKAAVLDKDKRYPRPSGVSMFTSINGTTPNNAFWSAVDFDIGVTHYEPILSNYSGVLTIGIEMIDYSQDLSTENRNLTSRAIAGDPRVAPEVIDRYRGWVDELIQFAKSTKRKVYLKIGYEFDGHWNNYEPESYKAAFRYIKKRIDDLGAWRVATVWQTAAWGADIPEKPIVGKENYEVAKAVKDGKAIEFFDKWYPGDDVVDWMGISQFMTQNYKREGGPWACDRTENPEVIAPRAVQNAMLDYARLHNKPVMVAEAAPAGYDLGDLTVACRFREGEPWLDANKTTLTPQQIWKEWFAPTFEYVRQNRDVIRSITYINAHWESQLNWLCGPLPSGDIRCNDNYWGDSRIETQPYILDKVKAELRDRRFWEIGRRFTRKFEAPDFSKGRGVYEAEYSEGDAFKQCCGLGTLGLVNLSASNEREVMVLNFGDGGQGRYGVNFERVKPGKAIIVTLRGNPTPAVADGTFRVLVNGKQVGESVPLPSSTEFEDFRFETKVPPGATVRVEMNPNSGGEIFWLDKIKIVRR